MYWVSGIPATTAPASFEDLGGAELLMTFMFPRYSVGMESYASV